MKLEDALSHLGLDQKETTLYLAALELGESLLYPLAQHAHLKRSAVYELLPKLHDLGLLTYGRRGKRRTIVAQDPNTLLSVQESRLKDIQTVLPELMSRFHYKGDKATVRSYEGVEGIKQVYEDTLSEELPINSFLQVQHMDEAVKAYLLESYVPRRVKRGIRVKNLVSGTPAEAEKTVPDKGAYRENRFVDSKDYPAEIELLIYGNKVAFITFKPDSQPVGIVIESGDIALTLRSLHRLGWTSTAGK